jgi:hypothetical protein
MAARRIVPLGHVVMTRAVNDAIADHTPFAEFALETIRRHASGDWGELPAEDWRENELSIERGFRLLSSYPLPEAITRTLDAPNDRLWVITEADRSVTTLLWPSEY